MGTFLVRILQGVGHVFERQIVAETADLARAKAEAELQDGIPILADGISVDWREDRDCCEVRDEQILSVELLDM